MDKLDLNQRIFVVDTETESLNLSYSRPWEFAWVEMVNGKVVDSQSRYLWWEDLNVGEGAIKVTGFDYQTYKEKALDSKRVFEEIKPWFFSDSLICFHNGLGFDVYQIRNWFREIGESEDFSWVKRCVDTMSLAKAWKMGSKPEENFDAWQYRWLNFIKKGLKCSVSALCAEFGIEIDATRTHQGDYDCYLTAQIYKNLVYRLKEV